MKKYLFLGFIFLYLTGFSQEKKMNVVFIWSLGIHEKKDYMVRTADSLYFFSINSKKAEVSFVQFDVIIPDTMKQGDMLKFEIYWKKPHKKTYIMASWSCHELYYENLEDIIRFWKNKNFKPRFNAFQIDKSKENLQSQLKNRNISEEEFKQMRPDRVIPYSYEEFRKYYKW